MDTTRIIKILDAENGKYEEIKPEKPLIEAVAPYPRDFYGRATIDHTKVVALQETGGRLSTYNFPDALRMGLQFDAWTAYNEPQVTYPQFCRMVDSNKQYEEYLKDSPVGLLPKVAEGQPYPEVTTDLGDGRKIYNDKRGMIMSVTREMQKFDQLGKAREVAELLGRSARLTEEQDAMSVLTTTSNYTKAGNTGDNDETAAGNGANFQAITFGAAGLITAFNILRTMKDRKTKVYKNVLPNTLVVTPKLWWAARQLIMSPDTMRASANNSAEVYGTGSKNSFFDVVDTIIVSPQFGNSYGWALLDRSRALVFQRVEPFSVLFEGANAYSTGYFERDILRYRIDNWYGVGMRDDSFAFLSTSTTAPVVD